MSINPKIFQAYDIRGIYPDDFGDEVVSSIMRSAYTYFIKRLGKTNITIALGRDMRTSTPTLFKEASSALIESGATVVDIGLVSTPTFYFATLKYEYDAGIMITASHNPKQYNGFKFVIRDGSKLSKIGRDSGMTEMRDIAIGGSFAQKSSTGRLVQKEGVLEDEYQNAARLVNLKAKRFKVVCDSANGMAITYIKKFFEKVPADITYMNEELDGSFPAHEANPLKFETLASLQERVIAEGADFGIAPDADGDRIFFINEKGEIVPATYITSLIADSILRERPGEKLIVDIRYIKNVRNVVKKLGGKLSVSKIGHAFISEQMAREDAFFAGESSGHFFFRDTGYAESSLLVIAYVIKELSLSSKPISKLLAQYQSAHESGEYNFTFPQSTTAAELMSRIEQSYPDAEISDLDGISITYPQWRCNIRASNTEALLRLNVEADTKELMQSKLEELKSKLIEHGAVAE